jgi:lipopolysaccharide transport system ATP-binding protein
MSAIISLENVSKAYPVYARPSDFLREIISRKPRHDTFWALKDISLTIGEKQRVGVIGPNGSGKSTLLKIITGNLQPTSGKVMVNGVISAMLSLNTVLNQEDTGLRNIRFNLVLNGCAKSELERLTEEIIEFTELGSFIYAPVKTYSSGMNAKLAFAIATAIKPEILIIDEVLSVGDAYFMGKATKRMIDLCNQGKGLIFVSHSTSAIQMLCDTVIWMENGGIRNVGPVDYILKLYEEDYRRQEDETTREGNLRRKKASDVSAQPSELDGRQLYRLRIVADNANRNFEDTHYVRKLTLAGHGIGDQQIPLALHDIDDNNTDAALDLLGSEWSRFYTKDDHECRTLSAKSGKQKGGQIILKAPPGISASWPIKLSIEASSILGKEKLSIESLNHLTGNWERIGSVTEKDVGDGWRELVAECDIPVIDKDQFHATVKKIEQNAKPDVEITDVTLTCDERQTHVIEERQPFTINVHVNAVRPTAVADVGIRIIRSDGVYVFWQSSGLEAANFTDLEGKHTVSFVFDRNCLSSGEYNVSSYVANGWDFPQNYPYSEVFDRKINCLQFRVRNEHPGLDFGVLNIRVPVTYTKDPA